MINIKVKKDAISNFNIELTRRCNLKCDFCCRGKAQKLDISHEIIDKTFDELKNTTILSIQFSGGEPTLVPELFDYAIDRIISNNIFIANVGIFTNGMILNPEILKSIQKLLNYIKTKSVISNENCAKLLDVYHSKYSDKRFCVIISDVQHQNGEKLEAAMNFYNQIVDKYYEVVLQSVKLGGNGCIELSGRALETYQNILPKPVAVSKIRVPINKYYFISYLDDMGYRITTGCILNVSSNGNIYLNGESYVNIDSDPICNIMNCNMNLVDTLEKWCWKYPYGFKATKVMEVYHTLKFCQKHNIELEDDFNSTYNVYNAFVELIQYLNNVISSLHNQYPLFNFNECEIIAAYNLYSFMIENSGKTPNDAIFFLSKITDCDISMLKSFTLPFSAALFFIKCKNKYGYKD